MDAGAGHIEVSADKRGTRRNFITDLLFKIPRDFRNYGEIHAVVCPAQRSIFNCHCLKGAVSCALSDAEHGAVDRGAAVQPCRCGVGYDLVKIVMPVPFQKLRGHAGIMMQPVDNPAHAARQRRARIGNAKAHSIACADLDGDAAFLRELLQSRGKGNHKAVKIGARDIFKMAAGGNTVFHNA